jgi:hypothetical protein
MGILDPTKVTRAALQHAASISGLMITTEAMVTEIPQSDSAAAAPVRIFCKVSYQKKPRKNEAFFLIFIDKYFFILQGVWSI